MSKERDRFRLNRVFRNVNELVNTTSTPSLSINDLTDVTITSPTNGQVIKWNGSQWINDSDNVGGGGGGGGVTDHGALTGLADDDHAQYFNEARGDARYELKTTSGVATLDFGTGSNEASIVVNTPVPVSSNIRTYVLGTDTTTDHTANDHVYFNLLTKAAVTNLVANTSFTIKAVSAEKLSGTFKVRWFY